MSRLFRLGAVLRARQAQEDAAKGEVVRVRRAARHAASLASQRETTLNETDVPAVGVARAVVAALAARQTLAAELSMARQLVAEAEQETAERINDLAEKAKNRRAVEKLVERHAVEEQRLARAADQRVLDELAATGPQRAAMQETVS
ncbi:flagellar FliJ family protein [Micromonospora sp. NPDC049679]|uniref:flagellar FliJ family protein n=1 Tax=Micromonospora sp. NPDC049679 TaxID=3155920 RepID=UPI0033E94D85